ncbi:hypothetical protein BSP239C_04042 [Brevibacterium sp. 239c]|uniref:hypothetical protein n=1 Tax=Brevibacterium sp. 239c TaxID=1965356 RepID=UPI000C4C1AD5|nr:hypothetical protein [Brevibacterium sp. 239c]SMY05058.1 hypothetical protein BSP239C_04042 [Brevibacterium sp. 239c]
MADISDEVRRVAAWVPLRPEEDEEFWTQEVLEEFSAQLDAIKTPMTRAEQEALVPLLLTSEDIDLFGVMWKVVHLFEESSQDLKWLPTGVGTWARVVARGLGPRKWEPLDDQSVVRPQIARMAAWAPAPPDSDREFWTQERLDAFGEDQDACPYPLTRAEQEALVPLLNVDKRRTSVEGELLLLADLMQDGPVEISHLPNIEGTWLAWTHSTRRFEEGKKRIDAKRKR